MKPKYGQLLLQDKFNQDLLKEMILQKFDHYNHAQILSEAEIDDLLRGKVTVVGINKIISHYETKDELVLLERDLSSMCYSFNKSRNKVPDNTKWEIAYEYATQIVQIADVITNLLGVTNFNRNIKCPFHEDKSPSLKIYTNNNRFVCFGCSARGSPIDFVMKYKTAPFKEAVLYLSNI